jgi:hypothetical protein
MLERCCICDNPTGGAGKGEDSLYIPLFRDGDMYAELGPLCPDCYDQLREDADPCTGTCSTCGGQLREGYTFCPYCGEFAKAGDAT